MDLSSDPAEGSHVEGGVVEHPSADDFGQAHALPADRTWFKRAVFYEVLVRAFYDSNSDGAGDLRGLIEHAACMREPPQSLGRLRGVGSGIEERGHGRPPRKVV